MVRAIRCLFGNAPIWSMDMIEPIGLYLMWDTCHLSQNIQNIFSDDVNHTAYALHWCTNKGEGLGLGCHLLKHLQPRSRFLIRKNVFNCSLLKLLIGWFLSGSKVKLQLQVHFCRFLQLEVTLTLFKSTLIGWLNFDPGHKHFNMGDYLLNKFVVLLSGNPVFYISIRPPLFYFLFASFIIYIVNTNRRRGGWEQG